MGPTAIDLIKFIDVSTTNGGYSPNVGRAIRYAVSKLAKMMRRDASMSALSDNVGLLEADVSETTFVAYKSRVLRAVRDYRHRNGVPLEDNGSPGKSSKKSFMDWQVVTGGAPGTVRLPEGLSSCQLKAASGQLIAIAELLREQSLILKDCK